MVSKVQKWGNSLAIRIPRAFAEETAIAEDTSVEIFVEDGRIVVAPARHEWRLSQLLAKMTPENTHREISWGKAAGKEAW